MPQTPAVDTLLNQLRETLKEELRAEVRAEIIAELQGGTKPVAKKPGPKPTKSAPPPKASTASSKSSALKVKAGQRRTADDIGEAASEIMGYVRKNPGSRVDQIAAALGAPVKDLQLPIQMLLSHKELKKAGRLRGTTYTAKG